MHPVDDGDRGAREQSPGIGSERLHREVNAKYPRPGVKERAAAHRELGSVPPFVAMVESPLNASSLAYQMRFSRLCSTTIVTTLSVPSASAPIELIDVAPPSGSEGFAAGAEPVSGVTLRRQPTLTPAVTSASVSGVGISTRFSLTGSASVSTRVDAFGESSRLRHAGVVGSSA